MYSFLKSLYAGIVIGLGGFVYLSIDNKIIGSLLFSIGLLSVMVFELNLFTGKVCSLENYKNPFKLIFIFLINFLGAEFMAVLSALSMKENIYKKAIDLYTTKISKSPSTIIVDGIICGICIGIAVKGYKKANDFGKYILVIFAVMVFILVGSEHVVANMYYMLFAGIIDENIYDFKQVLYFLILNGAGNTIGGFLVAGIDKELEKKENSHG